MPLCLESLPEEVILQILSETPISTLFDSMRFVSRAYNVRVHKLFTSPRYINYILQRFDPCFKLQLSYPDGPSRPDLFMNASLVMPWPPPRDLYRVKMRLEGHFGGFEDRVMVWIDGNYKPITSLAVRWVDDEQWLAETPGLQSVKTQSSGDSDSTMDFVMQNNFDTVAADEGPATTLLQYTPETRKGWYEGIVDWWSIFSNMAKVRPRDPGDYGKNPSRSFLAFTRLSKFDFWSRNPLQILLRHELNRGVIDDQEFLL